MIGWRVGALGAIPEVGSTRTLLRWPDTVAPVITVGKAAPREANDRSFDFAHVLDKLAPNAVDIGDLGVLPHPDTVVNNAAEVLGAVAVDIVRDRAKLFAQQHLNARRSTGDRGKCGFRAPEQQQAASCQRSLAEKRSTFHHCSTFPKRFDKRPIVNVPP